MPSSNAPKHPRTDAIASTTTLPPHLMFTSQWRNAEREGGSGNARNTQHEVRLPNAPVYHSLTFRRR
eukprot:4391021-Alexandrium_andersonii.AAC.1